MNKLTPFLVGAVVLIGLIIFFAQTQPAYYSWRNSFGTEGENPYDAKILYDILDGTFELDRIKDRVNKVLPDDDSTAALKSYLYVGNTPKYTEAEAWHLRKYVREGGTAMIISQQIPDSLAEILFYPEDCGGMSSWAGRNPSISTEKVFASFKHPDLSENYYEFTYVYEDFVQYYRWTYIPVSAFCESDRDAAYFREYPIAALGAFEDKSEEEDPNEIPFPELETSKGELVNFVRLKVGEGYFYFHTNPIMFTNLFLVDTAGFEYASNVLAHLPTDGIYWDRESVRLPDAEKETRAERPKLPAQSPLEYIFSQPALRTSWYLFLSLAAIYVFFGAKRRQRKIPILETNRNTSLEFVETIGRLYFQQQDHKGIVKKQMHLFLAHIRQRYHLVTRNLDDKLIDRVAIRAKVDRAIVNDIFVEYFRLRKTLQNPRATVPVETLNNFYLLIERFHAAVRKNEFVASE